jgi:hypothetical protein
MSRLPADEAITRFAPFVNYKPHRYQRALHALRLRLHKRIRLSCAGRRGGKTYSGGADFVDSILRDYVDRRAGKGRFESFGPTEFGGWVGSDPEPLLRYWVVTPTYELGGEPKTVLQRLLGFASDGGLILEQDRSKGQWRLRGGILIEFKSAERPERLVSRGVDGLWIDEAARMKAEAWLDHLPATIADRQGWVICTTTPLGRNWFWRHLWVLGDPVEAELAAEDGEEIAQDRAVGCVRWFEASFAAFIGQIFPFLDQSRHIAPRNLAWTPSSFERIVAGFDSGWRHPAVITVWGVRRGLFVELETVALRETVLVAQEGRGHGWTDIATDLRKRWPFEAIWCPGDDPEAAMQFRQAGITTRPAYQDRLAGRDWFATGLWNDEIKLSTPAVFHEFEGLRHPEGRTGREAELWVKEDDDRFDASRYALTDYIRDGRLATTQRVALVKSVLTR